MIEWKISNRLQDYESSVSWMENRVSQIHQNEKSECVWLLEHPTLFTAGTSAKQKDLLNPTFPVYASGRGGQYTYHGPGQRIAYVMLDLKSRQARPDLKHYVWQLEEWIIRTLDVFDIKGLRREGRVGIWVEGQKQDFKIAAIGVRIRHWVTYHGISINLNPDLTHFKDIVPCGISDQGVTSLHELGRSDLCLSSLDDALKKTWPLVFEKT